MWYKVYNIVGISLGMSQGDLVVSVRGCSQQAQIKIPASHSFLELTKSCAHQQGSIPCVCDLPNKKECMWKKIEFKKKKKKKISFLKYHDIRMNDPIFIPPPIGKMPPP